MGIIHKVESDEEKYKELSKKIFKAQIILDRLKDAVKIGQKNINRLREESKVLRREILN